VALAAFAIFFLRLWEGSLDGDPVVYAAVAKGIAQGGDWSTLWLGTEPYFNKPPLMFWLTALLFRLFGVSTFTACFWSAAFAAGSCLALYRLGRELFDRPTALTGALVLLSTPDFLQFSTRFRLESVCAFFLILTLLEVVRSVRRSNPGPLARAGLWIGLCFMAKGAPGFIALSCLAVTLVWSRAGSLLLTRRAALGMVAMLALALLWPLIQWQRHGAPYLEQAIGSELIARVTEESTSSRSYLSVIASRYWPWLPFFLLGVWKLVRVERREHPEAFRLLVAWIAVTFVLLSLAAFPYGRYLSSVWPAFALIAGRWLAQRLGAQRIEALTRAVPLLVSAVAILIAVLPVPIHTDRAESARQLGALIDTIHPELDAVVSYRESHPFWRGQFAFYLDRDLRVVNTLEELSQDPALVVISRREPAAEIEREGWRPLMRGRRWTVYLRPSAEPAASAEPPILSPPPPVEGE
jgi:4-amino-4-deoxy-L-arabinose transferase-like glycosyltransferase